MSRRLVIAAVIGSAVAVGVAPSFAQSGPVSVQRTTTSSGTSVGVFFEGQAVAGLTVYNDGAVCFGISQQLPVCTPVASATRQTPLPVTVYRGSNGTGVGAGDVGVFVGNDGEVCPVVSTQDWQCVGTNP